MKKNFEDFNGSKFLAAPLPFSVDESVYWMNKIHFP